MSNLESVDQSNFSSNVLENEKPVIVDFWAEWCGPCRSLTPILDEVAGEFNGKASIVKVNVDQNNELAQQYGVRGIPTMIFFKNGEVKNTLVGLQPKNEIIKTLNDLL